MRRKLIVAGIVALLVGAGCQGRPSREQSRAACQHQVELGFWSGYNKSITRQGLDPTSAEVKKLGVDGLAKEREGKAWKAQVEKCAKSYQKLATKKQLDCITTAKTSDEALACVKK